MIDDVKNTNVKYVLIEFAVKSTEDDRRLNDILADLLDNHASRYGSFKLLGWRFPSKWRPTRVVKADEELFAKSPLWAPLRYATPGVIRIAAERQRQFDEEGWTAEHDDQHEAEELAQAAACYAWPAMRPAYVKKAWPWGRRWWKPGMPGDVTGRLKDLVRAGALIAAEIDRLLRKEEA